MNTFRQLSIKAKFDVIAALLFLPIILLGIYANVAAERWLIVLLFVPLLPFWIWVLIYRLKTPRSKGKEESD